MELGEQIFETREVAGRAVEIIGLTQGVAQAGVQGRLSYPDEPPPHFVPHGLVDQHKLLHAGTNVNQAWQLHLLRERNGQA
jgi:hypothetical protein